MNKLIPISFIALAALEGSARADQCAWVDADVAARARAIVASAPKVLAFCEPCGDSVPGVPSAPAAVDVRAPSHDYHEVTIGGRGIDLAYTFVQTSAGTYDNLARLAGCPATGVSPSLHVAPETKDGVLITAAAATKPPVAPAKEETACTPTEPASVAPHVYTHTTTHYELAWPVLAVAGVGGFAFGALATLLLFALRRRGGMRPRATELR